MDEQFKVKCPKCGSEQLVAPRGGNIKGKRKSCVYCGHNFCIYKNVNQHRLV